MAEQFGKLKNGLIKCRDYIFNFLENPAIPPDNNASYHNLNIIPTFYLTAQRIAV